MNRRKAIQSFGMALGAASIPWPTDALHPNKSVLKGNIKHSVSRWCFDSIPMETFAPAVQALGCSGIDLLGPKDWPLVKQLGLDSTMCYWADEMSQTNSWNRLENHPQLIADYTRYINTVADAGYTNLICFSGNRNGMDDAEGLQNCVQGFKQILPLAEKRGVVLQIEVFNSKIDHPDYMADSSAWSVALCKALGSENFKVLYDIYHMQINEGDIIRTIQDHHEYFGHYHTAGVPGRHEIDDTQELYYPAIMKAIAATGFQGYVAQEFIPTWEKPLDALADAIRICDV